MSDSTSWPFAVYTIYERPLDYPSGYVVRSWLIRPGEAVAGDAQYLETLSEARSSVPEGLWCLDRSFHDDPVIVETWM